MVSFDTNILVYATLSAPLAKTHRARDLLLRGMRAGSSINNDRTPGERCCLCKALRLTIFRRHSMR